MSEHERAADALTTIRAHEDRAHRAARLPWWVYAGMFVLAAAGSAVNDFVDLSGAKLVAVVILVALAVTVAITFAGRSAPLSRLRGVQPRQTFVPWVFGVVVVVMGVGGWLVSRYGTDVARHLADAVGLSGYPNTVAGVLYGAAFTALFAATQLLTAAATRRSTR